MSSVASPEGDEPRGNGPFGTAHVVVVFGASAGATHPIGPRGLMIGRVGDTSTADMTLPDGRVSRLHARIARTGPHAHWFLRDLGSRNGGSIDGAPFAGNTETLLRDGAVIRLGDTLMIFRAEAPAIDPSAPLREKRESILDLTGGAARWTVDAAECLLVYPWTDASELRAVVDSLSESSLGALSLKTLPEHVRSIRRR